MRKPNLFSAVLTLFLLVPASITWAQTVSLTGVVYENQTVKIPFKVPEGDIKIYLPDDMAAGDIISGTIVIEPAGRTAKQKQKNLDLLKKYSLSIGSKPGSADLFDSKTTELVFAAADNGARFGFTSIYDVCLTQRCTSNFDIKLDDKTVSRAEVPLIRIGPPTTESKTPPKKPSGLDITWDIAEYEMLKRVIHESENIILGYKPGVGGPAWWVPATASLYVNDKKVNTFCSSPRKLVVNVPKGTIGKAIITAKDNTGKTIFTDDVYVVSIKASVDKTNLRRGERTNLHVSVEGTDQCPYPVSVSIINKTSDVILLDKGLHQTYHVNPAFNPKEYSAGKTGPFEIRQGVTGVVPGSYDINASLVLPAVAFGDIFHQQKSALKTPEDYNAWVDALKKDLKAYADKQGGDEVGKAAKANAQRAIDNIQKCHDKNKLDECKAFADAFLRPVSIPAAAATMWVCGFEAYKAAIKAITGTLAGKPELIDWEVIKNGLEFIRNMGEKLNDEALQNGAAEAKKIVDDIRKTGETKERLEKLNEKLKELTPKLNNKISTDPTPYSAYTMQDLLVSSYMAYISVYRPADGSLISLNMDNNSSAGLYSVNDIAQRSYEMNISPGMSPVLLDWMNSFINNKTVFQDLNITIPSPGGGPSKMIDFFHATITEFTIPEMDAANKRQPMMINVRFKPESIKYANSGEKLRTIDQQKSKQWMPNNFKIDLGDLPCKRINKIEALKFETKTSDETKDFRKELKPAKIEIPEVIFTVPQADIEGYKKWYNDFVIDGKNDVANYKNGRIEYSDENGASLFSFSLNKVKPVQIDPAGDGYFKVTVHPTDVTFNYSILNDPGLNEKAPIQFEQKPLDKPRRLEDKALQIGLHQAIKKLVADAGGARGQTWNTVCDNCRQCIEARMGTWAADLVKELGEGIIKEYLGKAVDLIGESVKAVGAAKEFFDKISDKTDNAEKLADDIAAKIKAGELQVLELKPELCKKSSYCLIRGTIFYNPKTGCVFAIIYCEGTSLCCPNVQTVVTLTYCTNEDGMPKDLPDIDVIKK